MMTFKQTSLTTMLLFLYLDFIRLHFTSCCCIGFISLMLWFLGMPKQISYYAIADFCVHHGTCGQQGDFLKNFRDFSQSNLSSSDTFTLLKAEITIFQSVLSEK